MSHLERVRTFIAIELPSKIQQEIAKLQAMLKKENVRVSWTKTENIHLTLKFLGDVELNRIAQISAAVQTACYNKSPFRLTVEATGCFPNRKNPRVLWVGISGDEEKLFALQKDIENELVKLGFEKEKRKYSAHLTVGRVKSPFGMRSVIEKMETSLFIGGELIVKNVNVMKSVLHPQGAIYTLLSKINLESE